ncbi:MAG TPA: PIG-L deacetylase family protein [Acidimicrobiales bacterium]|nr:PIG-L deacetylase family protein [Acidimicrobiales bacterium]
MTPRRPRAAGDDATLDVVGLPSVVAVCAHPDDESFGLGAVIGSLTAAGTSTSVLSFTHGEASTLHGAPGDLRAVRAAELAAAAHALTVSDVRLLDHADGSLDCIDLDMLVDDVVHYVHAVGAHGLLVFDLDGITGHRDHQRATEAALRAGESLDLPVIAWSIPASVADSLNAAFGTCFVGRREDEVDIVLRVDRSIQHRAIALHASQATDNPVLWRRLELMGDNEWLRWLRAPSVTG